MESLQANAGWERLCEIIHDCVEERDRKLDDPLDSMDGVPRQEYTKGARQAYRHILDMPDALIETSKNVIELTAPAEEEIEDGQEEEEPADDAGA